MGFYFKEFLNLLTVWSSIVVMGWIALRTFGERTTIASTGLDSTDAPELADEPVDLK